MKNKKIIFTSLLILLPSLIGVLIWGKLPNVIPTHFNFAGEADGFSSKPFAVFGLPIFILAVHLVCCLLIRHDPKSKNISSKVNNTVLFICPAVSILTTGLCYLKALGNDIDIVSIVFIFTGLLFIIIGNYLPKCQSNYTVGIKLPWTLNDPDNWQKTHRMAGPVWILGGAAVIVSSFLGKTGVYVFFISVVLMVLVPAIYSYNLYKNKRA